MYGIRPHRPMSPQEQEIAKEMNTNLLDKDNSCPYSLDITSIGRPDSSDVYRCIKGIHSDGYHESLSGKLWKQIDTRESSSTTTNVSNV
jgi:hypothetical protein